MQIRKSVFISFLLAVIAGSISAQTVTLPPGDYTVHSTGTTTFTPVVIPPPGCNGTPPPTSQHNDCQAPLQGSGWDQTRSVTCNTNATPPVYVTGTWTPATMPAGVCNPPSTFNWKAPVSPTLFTTVPRPAKGGTYLTYYGTTVKRVTDHTLDLGLAWLTDIYSRHQGFNANDSMLAVYRPDGGYQVYNPTTLASIKSLNGVGGDPEFQWSATDPQVGYYLGNYGSTSFKKIDVAANTSTTYYDFSAEVHTFAPDANRWSTKTEGSPSANGCIWALMGMHEQSGTWPTRGYAAFDICAKRMIWSKTATTEFDSISASPSGRWAVGNGTGNTPTVAFALDGSNTSKVLMDHGEHSDIVKQSDGHDALMVCNYKSGPDDGKCYSIDIDTGVRKDHFSLYNNPIIGTDYAVHISGKAFNKPDWVVIGTYGSGDNKSNLMLLNIKTSQLYGLSTLFANVPQSSYWPEPHAFPNRDLTKVCYNEDWGSYANNGVDVVCMDVPPLPTGPAIVQKVTTKATQTISVEKPVFVKKPTLIH